MDQTTLLQLKIDLYRGLLLTPNDRLSDNEVEIMYQLSKDKGIQGWLTNKRKIAKEMERAP
jgi:hypothetical protein